MRLNDPLIIKKLNKKSTCWCSKISHKRILEMEVALFKLFLWRLFENKNIWNIITNYFLVFLKKDIFFEYQSIVFSKPSLKDVVASHPNSFLIF